MNSKSHYNLRCLAECAVFVALSLALSYLKIPVASFGGSIDFVMVPLIIFAYRWGLWQGLLAGLAFGKAFDIAEVKRIVEPDGGSAHFGLGGDFASMATLPSVGGTHGEFVDEAFHEGGNGHSSELAFGLTGNSHRGAEKPFLRPGHDHALNIIVLHAPHGTGAAQFKGNSDNAIDFLRVYTKGDPLVAQTFKMLHGFLP